MAGRLDRGDTLIEVIMTVVIAAISVTALVSSLATAANAGRAHRDSVRIDAVMRNYAEATKAAGQACSPGAAYTVVYAAPEGFDVGAQPDGGVCPAAHAAKVLTLEVTGPGGLRQTMQVVVRTP